MDILVTDQLLELIMISITLSIIIMAIIQKLKNLPFIKKEYQIWILNLIFSFGIGIPFTIYFYNLDIYNGLWISLFSFIGAPSLYEMLKKQNMINYKPKSLEDTIEIPKENEIKRN